MSIKQTTDFISKDFILGPLTRQSFTFSSYCCRTKM